MKPYQIAEQGTARTFQNIALFKGMSTLDNIMTGRITHMKTNLLDQMLWWRSAETEEVANREVVERIIDFLEIQDIDHNQSREKVFAGWMFASSPALSPLEHAVYDIWVVSCSTVSGLSSSDNR